MDTKHLTTAWEAAKEANDPAAIEAAEAALRKAIPVISDDEVTIDFSI